MNGEWLRRSVTVTEAGGAANSTVVVFVHGILSSGETCWKNANGTYWPELLQNEESLPGVGIYVYTYQTGFFSGTYSLGDVVDDLKERLFNVDEVISQQRQQIVFVCHSMGGLVVRKLLVQRAADFIDHNLTTGLYLVASPSLGSGYANWLEPLAKFMDHAQADVLRFSQNNQWLNDLDREFQNLKESERLRLLGKELVEDKFVTLRGWLHKQVVEPFAGARYFGESYKVPASDHFSIAKPDSRAAIQHQLLIGFIRTVAEKDTAARTASVPANPPPAAGNALYITTKHGDVLVHGPKIINNH